MTARSGNGASPGAERRSGLFDSPGLDGEELFETLAEGVEVRIERIVSPPGYRGEEGAWYDQERDEWVLVASGWARLEIEGGEEVELGPGDSLRLPAHRRHRVAETAADRPTVWLAVHYRSEE